MSLRWREMHVVTDVCRQCNSENKYPASAVVKNLKLRDDSAFPHRYSFHCYDFSCFLSEDEIGSMVISQL